MRLLPLFLFALAGCDDTIYGKPDTATTGTADNGTTTTDNGTTGDNGDNGDNGTTTDNGDNGTTTDTSVPSNDFCGVQSIFNQSCVSGCHDNSAPSGYLDLQTDPYHAIVNVTSPEYGPAVLVVPGSSATSLLYAKMTNTQTGSQGGMMPTAGLLSAAKIAVIKDWIDAGASSECDGPVDTSTTGGYHPPGFDDPGVHGQEAMCQEDTCTTCHGSDLTGGTSGVSCDSCHASNWRTDCTYCHGGGDNNTGAPPVDFDGSSTGISFPEHTSHVEENNHAAWDDCTQCHSRPTDVLTPGHFLVGDSTACVAELDFSAGLSSRGTYGGSGSCSNLYCHSNGSSSTATGSARTGSTYGCGDCHASSARSLPDNHDEHGEFDCDECHGTTVTGNTTISTPANHVDGEKDVALPSGMTWSSGRCNGSCHGESHSNRSW